MRTPTTFFLAVATALPLAASAADGEPRFLDRELLVETLTLDEQEPLADAEAALAAAQAELDAAVAERDTAATAVATATADVFNAQAALTAAEDALALDPTNLDLQAAVDAAMADLLASETALDGAEADLAAKEAIVGEKQAVVGAKTAAVEAILDEIALTGELVGELSDKQVQALNAALHSKTRLLPFDIDSALLQRIIDAELGVGPIHQLVMAYAQEARFLQLAARFDEKAAEAESDQFAEHAERAREKAASEFDKFVDKVDTASARAEAREALQEERRAAIGGKALGQSK